MNMFAKEMKCILCHRGWARLRGGNICTHEDGFNRVLEEYICPKCGCCFEIMTKNQTKKEDPCKEKPPELEVGINWCVREIRDLKERVEKRESEQGSVNQRMYLALKDSIGRLSDDIVTLASDQVHTEEEVKKHGRLLKYIQDGMRGIQL